MTRVLIARGHAANPWDLGAWALLPAEFQVGYLRPLSNDYDTTTVPLRRFDVVTLRDLIPGPAPLRTALTATLGDRHFGIDDLLDQTDIVHAAELSYWFTADLAKRKRRHRYRLVVTAWETIPFTSVYRNPGSRRHRRAVLAHADLFVAATNRARQALLLEGVEPERIVVSFPGIDRQRFYEASSPDDDAPRHVVVSPGRLVWEKGHQDVIRAVAAIQRGLLNDETPVPTPRLVIVGSGPEGERLTAYAEELGVAHSVELRDFIPYADMPTLFASASAMVLASLPLAAGSLVPLGRPRVFWEEQFGLVLAEAMLSRLDIVACDSGAIPEVLDGTGHLVAPGDWMGIARALAGGPLQRPPAERISYPEGLLHRYSSEAAGERLAEAYSSLLQQPQRLDRSH